MACLLLGNPLAPCSEQAFQARDRTTGPVHQTAELFQGGLVLSLRSTHPLRFWALILLALATTTIAGGHLWERQLSERLRQAHRAGDLDKCMSYGEKLETLQWLPPELPSEFADCRRAIAQRHWQNGKLTAALTLQQELVDSIGREDLLKQQDQRQLQRWLSELRNMALSAFKAGDIDAAINLLEPLEANRRLAHGSLSLGLKEAWERNRLEHERLQRLIKQERWWAALESMNRLDHPWWQKQANSLREEVEGAIESLAEKQEHSSHGDGPTHTVPELELDAAVNKRMNQGMEAWSAFETACISLGGRVVENGPESLCKR